MRVAVLLLMIGCDGASSIEGDRDGDRIGDDVDPCLATAAEDAEDLDGDGRTGDTDPCPFDATDSDRDGDTVPDACDPFPDLAGDTHRCTMPLLDEALAGTIWTPRTGAQPWQIRDGLRTDPGSFASIVSQVGFEHATTTTFDVRVTLEEETTTSERYFKVWARAGEQPTRQDLGCALAATGEQAWRVVLFGDGVEASAFVGLPIPTEARVQITVATTAAGSNVRCVITPTGGDGYTVIAPDVVALPPGTLGFGVEEAGAAITGIGIYDSDDSPVFL
ncbi:MAG: hypothetical protein WKG01_30715 [Kofleriaceae bacterium]